MRRLWGRTNSVNVQKVLWCLLELDLPFERVDAGGPHGIVDTLAYRALNPNGFVPTLEEDGFVLWESNAIVRYLAAADEAGRLWPGGARDRADADRWMDWQATTFTPAMGDAFRHLVRRSPAERDEAVVARSLAEAETGAAILDAHLAGRDHVAGAAFGVADIAVGCAAHRWLNLPAAVTERPALRRWYEGLLARPAARTVLTTPIT